MSNNIVTSAFFFSSNKNLEISSKVKNVFDRNKFNLFYVSDIDEIILNKFEGIDLLILDFTEQILDDKSIELLIKLRDKKVINSIIVISIDRETDFSRLGQVIPYDDGFSSKLLDFSLNGFSSKNDTKIVDSNCVKIISDYLINSGISSKHLGYYLLIDSIIYFLNNKKFSSLSGNLYPYLANKYSIKVQCVEMRVRNCIHIAFENSNKMKFLKCPTIKEFLLHSLSQIYGLIFPKIVI